MPEMTTTMSGYENVQKAQRKHFKGKGKVMAKKPKLGSGGRFAALKNKLSGQKGVYNPAGLAAAIGRKKYGAKKMASMAAKGRMRNLPGMSMHPVVNCNEQMRRKSAEMGQAMGMGPMKMKSDTHTKDSKHF